MEFVPSKLVFQKKNEIFQGIAVTAGFRFTYHPSNKPFMAVNEIEGAWNTGENMQSLNGVPLSCGRFTSFLFQRRQRNSQELWDSYIIYRTGYFMR